jgi:menaquinone-dependent protoporphyrinogen oxidase
MSGDVLVTYATRAGATAGVADAIGRALAAAGLPVSVQPMAAVHDLSPYRAVVAGSAIQGGAWLPEAMAFVTARRAELVQRPFAAFLVCMTMAMPRVDTYRDHVAHWLAPVRALARPVSEGLFAGAFELAKVPRAPDRLRFRLSIRLGIWPTGDHRDWQAIGAWGQSLAPLLAR